MTIKFKIDSEAGVTFTTVEGAVTEQDIQGTRAQMLFDPNYRPSLSNLVDFTGASVKIDAMGAFRLAEWAGIRGERSAG